MAEKKLLAIGGPKHGQWLPDYSNEKIAVPIPRKLDYSLADPLTSGIDIVTYIKDSLIDPATKKRRAVYRYSELSGGEAYSALRSWLVDVFINSEPDEE